MHIFRHDGQCLVISGKLSTRSQSITLKPIVFQFINFFIVSVKCWLCPWSLNPRPLVDPLHDVFSHVYCGWFLLNFVCHRLCIHMAGRRYVFAYVPLDSMPDGIPCHMFHTGTSSVVRVHACAATNYISERIDTRNDHMCTA